jgi:hypothetical protein
MAVLLVSASVFSSHVPTRAANREIRAKFFQAFVFNGFYFCDWTSRRLPLNR